MEDLKNLIILNLKDLDIHKTKFKTEKEFENYIYLNLENLIKKFDNNVLVKRQIINTKESRQLKPDIIIGLNDILIELKYDIENLNDIYRLFYQAFKYSKLAKQLLIFYLYDPRKEMTSEDIRDLESFEKVKVIRKL